VTYRGQLLEIEMDLEKVKYALRDGERLVIRHETEELELTRKNPLAAACEQELRTAGATPRDRLPPARRRRSR
jgi:hypothetical protein